jgi:PAS domain S-box-containing protein
MMLPPNPNPTPRPVLAETPEEPADVRSFRRLFQDVPIGMFRSTPDGRFLEVNASLAASFGYESPEQMFAEVNRLGIARAIFVDPGQRPAMLERLRAGAGCWHVEEVPYRRRDGSLLATILSTCMQVDPVTGEEQMFGFIQDITERQRREAERRHQEQLMAVGMLASGVAHDFNNMICGINGFVELMREEENPAALRHLAERLHRATDRAHDLTSCLLRFARQGGDQPRSFSASEAVRNALDLFRAGRGARLPVHTELPADGPMLLGYPTQFQNAVLNLCINAKDALGVALEGRLVVRGATECLAPAAAEAFRPQALRPGPHFHLEVADNGPGMAPEVLSRCLDPFFSTKGALGSGLGLPSVQGALADHGGAMRIETAPGAGCRVHLFVPLAV